MTLKELIEKNTWPEIEALFLEIHPEAAKSMAGYKMVFEKLAAIETEATDMSILLKTETDDDEDYVDVSGLYNNPKTEEDTYSLGLELTPWRQWLGMDIHKKSFDNFSEQEILMHCLYEMTFEGFSEDDIQNVIG